MSGSKPWERSRPAVRAGGAPVEKSGGALHGAGAAAEAQPSPSADDAGWSALAGLTGAPAEGATGRSGSAAEERSRPAARLLRLLLRRYGLAGAEEGRLLEAACAEHAWSSLEAEAALEALARSGDAQVRARFWGERIVHVPEADALALLQREFPAQAEPLPLQQGVRELPGGASTRLLSRVLLGAAAQLARDGFAVTAKGRLHRKLCRSLEEELRLPEEGLSLLRLPPAWTLEYEPPLALALDLMAEHGWLSASGEGWLLDGERLRGWLERPMLQRESSLLRALTRRALRKGPSEAAAASATAGLEPDRWYRIRELEQAASVRGEPEAAQRCLRAWLELLRSCGWAELAETHDGEPVLRMQLAFDGQDGETADCEPLLAQPGGELWAASWSDYRAIWLLELVAERGELRELTSYRLTPRSLARLGQGGDGSGLASLLEQACGCPLPAATLGAIREWTASSEAVAAGGAERVRAFAAESGEDKFWAGCMGLLPQPAATPAGAAAARGQLRQACAQAEDPFGLQQLPAAEPTRQGRTELERSRPGLPAAWCEKPRRYHASTALQLLESALRIGLPVELSTAEGRHIFVPERVEREPGGGWTAGGRFRDSGGCPAGAGKLDSADKAALRLLLPR
ncbi:hypothetical protein ACTHPH_09945 [Paenibacillus pasadenensis]|uniref:Helicase XPB/Ssl2 N-terminal domain-containing protein n=1 Tax=Paenibacillus pasadenensis TaxID=217090 RepID=A0A2N5N7M5_9BACL|nr:hypothetical protein [Paenibacillus pasadenensis]PLT46354.1 hypothetical protein B8V81_4785 [Paenibacillus pasadenensis]